jgi:tyrosyl-tRNA synthetase
MSIPDDLMSEWFTLLTDRSQDEISKILAGHPNEAKKLLACDIITFYHGSEAATATLADWKKQFGGDSKQDPDNIDEVAVAASKLKEGVMPALELLVETKLCSSKSEARRMISATDKEDPKKSISPFNYGPERTRVTDVNSTVPITDGLVLRLGRKIVKVRLT